jgi:hypothetical protein
MATGTKSDFKIHHEEFFGGMNEIVQQNSNVFNAASSNAIRLVPRMLKGDYDRESFFKAVETLVSRRDPTSTGDAAIQKLEQGELQGVKLNRKIGPAYQTMDSFKKIQVDPREFSFILGQQAGEEALRDYVNTGALSVSTAIQRMSPSMVVDVTGETDKSLSAQYLIRAMSKMGDRAQRIRAWVMHSKPWFDLMEGQVSDKVTNISDVIVYGGSPGTLGRPVIVTDSPYLVNYQTVTSGPAGDNYIVLGLTEDAVVMNQSEEESIMSDILLGKENIIMQYQGEYAYNIRVKGFSFATSANPTAASLGTTGNWTFQMHDARLGPGVGLVVA